MTMVSAIFLTSIWPVMINTISGVRSVSEDYMNVAKILRFTALEKVVQIILPVAVPYIFTGMRLSLGLSWIVIIGAEMLSKGNGVGAWIWNAYDDLEYAHVIIGIILVGLIGFTLDLMMRKIADFFDYTKKGSAS
jgi:nitrate/nitrite transport system permease protein